MLRARAKQNAESSLIPTVSSNSVPPPGKVQDRDHTHYDGSSSRHRPLIRRNRQTTSSISQQFIPWNIDYKATSPICLIIGFLCFAVSFQIGYRLANGAFSDEAAWAFLVQVGRTSTTSATTNGQKAAPTIRLSRDVPPPIDNYYSRPHIRDPVPLIIGGSDGSGTRAFVQILELLNVPILVEDRGTMDVHGTELYDGAGWPALVSRVLNSTRSALYDLEDIPDPIRESAKMELGRFLKSIKIAGRGMVEAGIDRAWASGVVWAFKAPVSILLLPFFREQIPAMKVLHIVRDGRDVSLSENHSPVQKFYAAFYPDAEARHKSLLMYEEFGKDKRTNIKAMQIWNDWNKQVYDYGARHSDGKTLDILVMRTEDLLHYPLESVAILADFVGSQKSSHQLCCLSRLSADDLGQSHPGNPLEELGEAGEEKGAGGFRGPIMFDPHDFAEIRQRFRSFVSGTGNSQGDGNGDQTKGATGRRRLLEEKRDKNDRVDIFKSGGKLASVNNPENDLNTNAMALQQQGVWRFFSPGFNDVTRMHNLLREKRSIAASRASATQDQEDVKKRYGKWTKVLSEDPKLSSQLHKYGREALSLFGYEPPREFMDFHPHPELLPTCDASVVCPS